MPPRINKSEMKKAIFVLCLSALLCLSAGCGNGESKTGMNLGSSEQTASVSSQPAQQASPPSEAEVDPDLSEYLRVQEEMEPKRVEIQERMLEVIPEEYQDDEAFDLQIDVYDLNAFSTTFQLDIHSGELERAQKAVIEIHRMLQPLEEELKFQSEGYSFTIVNDGEAVAFIGSTRTPGEYSYLFGGEYGTFTEE